MLYVVDKCRSQLVEFMHQCAKVKYLVMDIVDSQQKGKVATFEVGVQLRFVQPIAFTSESFDAVAVYGMSEFLLRCNY